MSYDQLVCARKQCRKCSGELINPADQCDEVGPWTRWLASRPAKVILVGQDWGTVGYFQKHHGRDVSDNSTNKRLIEFLSLLGFNVLPANETDRQSGVFATNAILCLKRGEANEMSARVKKRWFRACQELLKWTIEESAAPTVIALGRHAFDSVVEAYRLNRQFRDAVEDRSPIHLDEHRVLFAVYHPAARPKDRNHSQMRDDWIRIARYLHPIVDRIATF
jgi:Uracil DNA glycosylase superfamily